MNIESFITARLLAERVSSSQFNEIHRLHTDPQVMKTLSPKGKPLLRKETRDQIRQCIEHWERHGFGFWVFRRKTDGEFIGRGGLKIYKIDGKDVIGLAYAVLSNYWNLGFATEIAQASLEVGFRRFGFSEIVSWTLPANLASQRVLEKFGFRYERDFEFAGLRHRFYRVVLLATRKPFSAATQLHPSLMVSQYDRELGPPALDSIAGPAGLFAP
jgi:ribosomal-protein-alanine N-acetyltransferase